MGAKAPLQPGMTALTGLEALSLAACSQVNDAHIGGLNAMSNLRVRDIRKTAVARTLKSLLLTMNFLHPAKINLVMISGGAKLVGNILQRQWLN
ncbi:hypothetical protein WJX73_006815 [Symbiochloris irregularis]|uniref:Uncharacterized protein n=1 Tax=Symbiochloris irregularis TaxID=706552 RepID=A0AAW1PGA5_9CHLO